MSLETKKRRRFNGTQDSGQEHEAASSSLLKSIFGDSAAAAAAAPTNGLFSNTPRWNIASREEEERQGGDSLKREKKHCRTPSRSDILCQRRELSKHSSDLVKSVTVILQDYVFPGVCESGIESNSEDTDELRLFSKKCAHVIRQDGVLVIDNKQVGSEDVSETRGHLSLFSLEWLREAAHRTNEIENEICKRLVAVGQTKWRHENDSAFRYHEVASRCRGRLDVRYQTDQEPFSVENQYLQSIVYELLGCDAKLVYRGLIYSLESSADQPWHQDGTALFDIKELDIDLPPYALNVFVPLLDINEEMGPTEYLIQSHLLSKQREILTQNQDDIANDETRIGPTLKFGSALIYDYRICHRGTSNLSRTTTRPMLYMIYARPWFQEHLNFGSERLFS